LVGAKRVLDSTPLYDAVATMDTVTLIRSAIRALLRAAGDALEVELRGVLSGVDDYASSAKPQIDWDDSDARAELIDSRAKDGFGCLGVLHGRELGVEVTEAAVLLATVLGQDLEETGDGCFRIARKVAPDRVIPVVDPDARHGHKTSARGFDGYKGHAAADPDSEIITDTVVTPGNAGDASVAEDLIDDLFAQADGEHHRAADSGPSGDDGTADDDDAGEWVVYGDAAYGTGAFLARLENAGIDAKCKTQPPHAPGGRFTKADFYIDLPAGEVTCPAGEVAALRFDKHGGGSAHFAPHCATCPLAPECSTAAAGRSINIGPHEDVLARARAAQSEADWAEDYRATRPKIERKLGHLMRRKHGGRRARVRGKAKVDADFNLLAAAANIARLAALGLHFNPTNGWRATTAT